VLSMDAGKIKEILKTEYAATREAMEEFNIVPLNLHLLGIYKGGTGSYLPSMVYWTDHFSGTPEADGDEMINERWMSLEELQSQLLFPSFEASLDMLENLMQKYLTPSNSTDTITIENIDGGPGSGRYPKGSGKKNSLSGADKKKITDRLVGKKTTDGITITGISSHAFDRLGGRHISPGRAEKIVTTGKPGPGNTERTTVYDSPGSRAVIDNVTGNIVTFMWRGQNK